MSVLEIEATFRVGVVVAGSDPTATALSGILGNLQQTPDAMDELIKEVRSAFSHEPEIVASKINALVYPNAVIEEGSSNVSAHCPRLVPESGSTAGLRLPFIPASVRLLSLSSHSSSFFPLAKTLPP